MFDRSESAIRVFLGLIAFMSIGGLTFSAQAQQTAPAAQTIRSTQRVVTLQDLAKSVHNPFDDFITVPIQATTGFKIGPGDDTGEAVNVQPVIPFSLNSDWVLIARPNLSVAYSPSPRAQTGLTDLQTSFFLTPYHASEWIWGVGPIFQYPTASSSNLGNGLWAAGPTAAMIYSSGPWFAGLLSYQLMSFAGNRLRGSINQTYVEPYVSYNLESGWSVDSDPQMTFNWTADRANGWTIPMGADAGKSFKVGSRGLSLQAGAYYLLQQPQGAPEWIFRVQTTIQFPSGW